MNYLNLIFYAFLNFFSREPNFETLSYEIIDQHKKEVLLPAKISISSTGGRNEEDGIKIIHLGVSTYGPSTLEEARKLLLFLTEDLLNRYNESEKVKSFLQGKFMNINQIAYVVRYEKNNGNFWTQNPQNPKPEIARASINRGRIFYCINLSDEFAPLKEIHTETYEEAKKILLQEKQ